LVVSEPVLVLDGVWKGFDRGGVFSVLEDVSLTVFAREVQSVVANRDQGKSTLVRIAAGLVRPDRGSVRVAGVELGDLKDSEHSAVLRELVGLAARAGPGTQPWMGEYVKLRLASGQGLSRRERCMRVAAVLERLDVADCARSRWADLSNLQRMRVELAQAIVTKPKLLLVDDIIDGLGLGKTKDAMELLRELAQEVGCGVLMVASDDLAAIPSDVVWKLTGKKLRLMADNRTDSNIRPIDNAITAHRAS
jgi:ABC-type methionine transport system ATPase subunit